MPANVRAVGETAARRLAEVRREVASHRTLSDVVQWVAAVGPRHAVIDAIAQDEYTHDVVVSYLGDTYLVYDVT